MIAYCGCKADREGVTTAAQYQDARYGLGKRVANPTDDGTPRCTVCGFDIKPPSPLKKKTKEKEKDKVKA